MIEFQGAAFSLPADLHYLNCAYMAPLPKIVEEAGVRGIARKRVPVDIGPESFFRETDRVRALFARLIHAEDPRRIAIVPAASYGIAVAALNAPRERGQNIVVAHEQFPSNLYAWRSLCEADGLELRTVGPEADRPRGESWNQRLLEAIDSRTAVVALPHVHWTDGTRFDLEAIGRRAREVDAMLVVDGTQSVGALDLDVRTVQPDAVICASYKWLLGPYSLGVAYFGPRFDGGRPLEQNWIAREGSEDFGGLVRYPSEFQPGALRYDVGERSNFALMPMLAAALELLLGWQVDEVQRYCRALTDEVVWEAREIGFAATEDAWRSGHIVGVRAPDRLDPARLQEELRRRNIHVSSRGTALRISPHLYNTTADVAALMEALRAAVA